MTETPGATRAQQIMVTGGTGFFGRALVRRLLAAGHSVRLLSRRDAAVHHPRLTVYRGELADVPTLTAAMRGASAVFHCAAEKHATELMTEVNVAGTKRIFDLARELSMRHFCHLSSVGVIGKTRFREVDETAACNPMNRYEETKLAGEQILNEGMDQGIVVILRPTNIFGAQSLEPFLDDSWRTSVRRFVKGRENAHFVYVEDVAAAATYLLDAPALEKVGIFIVSSDEEPGNTYTGIQAAVASRIATAPRPCKLTAPMFVPYCARQLVNGAANYGQITYSSRKLRARGFDFPFGLRRGLDDAIDKLQIDAGRCS
jgi:nucleoside-diphosphate-sugar epimerase